MLLIVNDALTLSLFLMKVIGIIENMSCYSGLNICNKILIYLKKNKDLYMIFIEKIKNNNCDNEGIFDTSKYPLISFNSYYHLTKDKFEKIK